MKFGRLCKMAITLTGGKHNHSDLVFYYSGSEDCTPGHAYGPAVRDNYLIHYVRSGQGIFRTGNSVYTLRQGQGFLICPGVVTYYQADQIDPWSYSWVGFDGLKAESNLRYANVTGDVPIFTLKEESGMIDCFAMLEEAKKLSHGRELRLLSGLYYFFSHLTEYTAGERTVNTADQKQLYVKASIEYIEKNYSRKMTIQELANYIGLNRSYFCAVFKDVAHVSPQEYLVNFRMERACELLADLALTVGDVARSIGYDDPLVFSKMFTKVIGTAPREYRKARLAT